jgi:hypothetical protein
VKGKTIEGEGEGEGEGKGEGKGEEEPSSTRYWERKHQNPGYLFQIIIATAKHKHTKN